MNLKMKQEKVYQLQLKEISSKSREVDRISDWKIIPIVLLHVLFIYETGKGSPTWKWIFETHIFIKFIDVGKQILTYMIYLTLPSFKRI